MSISHGIDPIKARRDKRAALKLQQTRHITFRQAAYKVHAMKESEFANALLDRAYGKPAVKEENEIVDLPPVVIQLTGPSENLQ